MSFSRALRSTVSVLAGYMLFAVSAFLLVKIFKQSPHQVAPIWFMVFATAVGMVGAGLGGYVAGALAGSHPLGHAIGVAAVLMVRATASLISTLGRGAIWSQVAALALMAPSAILGGWIRNRQGTPA